MSRALALGVCLAILFWPSKVAVPPPPPPDPFPITSMFILDDEQQVVAQQVEGRLRDHGFSDELIIGALVNAYAESKLDVAVVGKAGERGIFQLNPKGLGHNMTKEEMRGIDTSVDRIAAAVKKNERLMALEARGGTAEQHASLFCKEIERPKHKNRKALERVRLMERIMIN
jgi:hypothetical protein